MVQDRDDDNQNEVSVWEVRACFFVTACLVCIGLIAEFAFDAHQVARIMLYGSFGGFGAGFAISLIGSKPAVRAVAVLLVLLGVVLLADTCGI